MRLVLTGGGTGGHLFPNIAISESLVHLAKEKRIKAPELFYIGEKDSFEEKILRDKGIPFYGIHAGKLRRYLDLKNVLDFFKVPLGFFEARSILKKIKPDLVFAKGGYVSVPVVLAAASLKIPLWIHESDVSPGLATRITSRFAKKIWLSFEESRRFFEGKNVEVVGNPIRPEITQGDAKKGYAFTGFSSKLPVVLIMGGSSGARSLNEIIFEALPTLLKKAQVLHITGSNTDIPQIKSLNYRHLTFINEELPDCYAMADVVVTRAGSGTIFELLACAKPMLLIPLPKTASRGDQIENAEIFTRNRYAKMLRQESLAASQFTRSLETFLNDEEARQNMIEHQKKSRLVEAAKIIAKSMMRDF